MADGLLDSHKRRILATYEHADKILGEIENLLQPVTGSPFQSNLLDLAPEQIRTIEDYIRQIRAAMVRFLAGQEIPFEKPQKSVGWAIQSALMSVDIAVVELDPKYLQGYGKIPEDASRDVVAMVDELQDLLKQMRAAINL